MTNYEKYKSAIIDTLANSASIALRDGKIETCLHGECSDCGFNKNNDCIAEKKNWLNAEYIERPKLTQRERQLCEFIETGWITRDKNGYLYASRSKPKKGVSMWSVSSCAWINPKVYRVEFPFIKWSDQEPWSVVDLLKLGVRE